MPISANGAHKVGRELGVISTCHVVCRDTQAEAEDYYHHYGAGMADNEALDRQLAIQKGRTVFDHLGELDEHRLRFAAGGGYHRAEQSQSQADRSDSRNYQRLGWLDLLRFINGESMG